MAGDHQITQEMIEDLRKRFLERYGDNIKKSLYDERDVERIQNVDAYLRLFLDNGKAGGDVEKAQVILHDSLVWRKAYDIRGISEESFPKGFRELDPIYFRNRDRNGHKLLYMCVKKSKTESKHKELFKRYLAWHMETHQQQNPGEQITILFDGHRAGITNVDADFVKFLINCFSTYFPGILANNLSFGMPPVLTSLWKGIRLVLPEEQRKKVEFVNKSEITKFVDPEQLQCWKHMKA